MFFSCAWSYEVKRCFAVKRIRYAGTRTSLKKRSYGDGGDIFSTA